MGTNRRYADQIDERNRERLLNAPPSPMTLPMQAFGPREIEWTQARPPVWVWVQFPDRPAERRKGYVKGHNDRVCVVWVDGLGGGWEIVVWRNAVSHRSVDVGARS